MEQIISAFDKAWRIVATGFCFALLGVGALILALLVFPLAFFFSAETHHRARKIIRHSFRFYLWTIQVLRIMDFKFENIDRLKQSHGALFIANHPTLLDYVVIASIVPCGCIVKESLFKNIMVKGVVKRAGYISNSSMFNKVFENCQKSLTHGENILLFPEGTRTVVGEPLKLKRSAANLALRINAPILILHISCSPATLTKGSKWYNVPCRRPVFTLKVGNKINMIDCKNQAGNILPLAARILNRKLEHELTKGV